MEKKITKVSGPNKRSPNYPSYSLLDCITFISKLNKQVGFREVHVEEAVQYMGHSPTSSTSQRVLASLDCFGLIEDRGEGNGKFIWLSRLAQEITMEQSGKDSNIPNDLLQKAALNDDMVFAAWKKWGQNLPPRNSIEKSLVFEFNFSQPGARRFASVLIDTYSYAHLLDKEIDSLEVTNNYSVTPTTSIEQPPIISNSQFPQKMSFSNNNEYEHELTDYTLPLKGGKKKVILRAPLGLSNDDFNHIIDWINLLKLGLISQEEED